MNLLCTFYETTNFQKQKHTSKMFIKKISLKSNKKSANRIYSTNQQKKQQRADYQSLIKIHNLKFQHGCKLLALYLYGDYTQMS